MIKNGFLYWMPLIFLAACSRAPLAENSRVSMTIPTADEFKSMNKNQKLKAMTVNSLVDYSRLCFYANVRGPGITDKSEACEPTVGLFAGGVGPGSQIQMEIPVGKDRVIEIYGVLRNSAQDTCWKSTDPVTRPTVDKFYFLGSSEAVEILPPSAEVSVSVQVPSVSQNIAVVNGWNSCPMATPVPVVQNETVGRPVLAAATLTGSQFKMKMQVSSKSEAFVQSGSQFKIKSWFNKGD